MEICLSNIERIWTNLLALEKDAPDKKNPKPNFENLVLLKESVNGFLDIIIDWGVLLKTQLTDYKGTAN